MVVIMRYYYKRNALTASHAYVQGWEFLCGPPQDEKGRPRELHCPWCDIVCDCEACRAGLAHRGVLGPAEPGDSFINERAYQVAGIKP